MHIRNQSRINTCLICGKKFHPFVKEAKYCGVVCKGLARRNGKTIACFYCNKPVYKKRKVLKTAKVFYCSRKCKDLDSKYDSALNEIREQAGKAVREKIQSGEIVRQKCELCDNLGHAHHYLGYEKKHWFDLRWLCNKHHGQEHQDYIRKKHNI